MKTQLLIPAAGAGVRLGSAGPKALVSVAGEMLLVHTLRRFAGLGLAEGAVIIVPLSYEAEFAGVLADAFPDTPFRITFGGAERQISVSNGLALLDADTDVVVIHDAARPFVSLDSVQASIAAAAEYGAATVAISSTDTILIGDDAQFLVDTPDRRRLWQCQTPQTFRVDVIRAAHDSARREEYTGTDDASLVRRMGGRVKLIMGTPLNFKVTTQADLAFAECVIREGLA